jgi:beta-N-acetylhexosaminidase
MDQGFLHPSGSGGASVIMWASRSVRGPNGPISGYCPCIMYRSGRWANPRIWGPAAVLTVIAAACVSNGPAGSAPTAAPPRPSATSPTTSRVPSPPASCANVVFDQLTLPQRVGQLFAMGLASDRLGPAELEAIRSHHVGSVWFTETTTGGASAVRAVATAVQAQATHAATGGVRFYVAANQEGGEIQALRGAGFSTIPSAVTQGTLDPATLRRDATTWGEELARAGVNLDFAPVMDVVPAGTETENAPIGQLDREFGSDPATVASHGAAFIRGMRAAGIVTTAKHFPGLGRVRGNTDTVAGVIDSVTTANDPSLQSFRTAVTASVPLVMVSLATYTRIDPNHLAAFSPTVMRLLRVGMRFDGVIASDSLTAAAVSNLSPAARAIDFLSAGGDLIVSKTVDPTVAMADAVVARASTDPTFGARVDDAVRHVLAAKDASGLLPCSGG